MGCLVDMAARTARFFRDGKELPGLLLRLPPSTGPLFAAVTPFNRGVTATLSAPPLPEGNGEGGGGGGGGCAVATPDADKSKAVLCALARAASGSGSGTGCGSGCVADLRAALAAEPQAVAAGLDGEPPLWLAATMDAGTPLLSYHCS
jgi:hypothetical protein